MGYNNKTILTYNREDSAIAGGALVRNEINKNDAYNTSVYNFAAADGSEFYAVVESNITSKASPDHHVIINDIREALKETTGKNMIMTTGFIENDDTGTYFTVTELNQRKPKYPTIGI